MGDVINNAKQTFSSWDKCMEKTYCKWPVIAAIILGAIIVASLLFCCMKCLCCAGECTCLCFKCLRGCCGSGRGGGSGHKRMPSNPYTPNQQYTSHPPAQMFPQAAPQPSNPYSAAYAAAPVAASPMYAQFETPSKPLNPDALPQHTTWNDAPKHHVLDDTPRDDDVELKPLAAAPSPVHTPLAGHEYNPYGGSYNSRPENSRQYSDPAYGPGYQESGVDRGDRDYGYGGQQQSGTYGGRGGPPAYEDAYARGASPGGYSGTTYAQNSHQETGYHSNSQGHQGYQGGQQEQGYQSYQPARQGSWHTTRRPVNGSFREV